MSGGDRIGGCCATPEDPRLGHCGNGNDQGRPICSGSSRLTVKFLQCGTNLSIVVATWSLDSYRIAIRILTSSCFF